MSGSLRNVLRYFLILFLASPLQAAGAPVGDMLDFAILRNGAEIGRHVFQFVQRGDPTIVRIRAEVDYRVAFIPLYMFRHEAREVWRDGRLVAMTAETEKNGDEYTVAVTREGDSLNLSVNGDVTPVAAGVMPASLWNNAVEGQRTIIDPADGELMNVSVRAAGEETIDVRGHQVRARRYEMTGEFQRDLWFDRKNELVQVRFKGEDGSDIRYRLR